MQELGSIHRGETILGKPNQDGSIYVTKIGSPGTGRGTPSLEEALKYAYEISTKENNE